METTDQNPVTNSKTDSFDEEQTFSSLHKLQKTHILLFISSAIMFLLAGACYSLLAPFFPIEAQKKGTSETVTGLVFSVYEITMALASPFYGVHMSKIGAEFVMKSGALVGGCCAILFGVLSKCPPGIPFVVCCFAVRIVEGIGFAGVFIATYTVLSCLFPKYSSLIMGMQQTLFATGIAVGPAIGGILYEIGGFGMPFFVAGGLVLVNGLVVVSILPKPPPAPESAKLSKFRLLKQPLVWVSLINDMLVAFSVTSLEPILALHLKQLNLRPVVVGVIFMIGPMCLVITTPFIGYLVDKKGHYFIGLVLGGVYHVVCMALIGPTPFLPFLHLRIWLVVVALMFQGPGISLIAQTRCLIIGAQEADYEDNKDTYSMVGSLVCSCFYFGAVIGTFLGGLLSDKMGFPNATTVFCGAFIVVVLVTIIYLVGRFKLWTFWETRRQGENSKLVTELSSPHMSKVS